MNRVGRSRGLCQLRALKHFDIFDDPTRMPRTFSRFRFFWTALGLTLGAVAPLAAGAPRSDEEHLELIRRIPLAGPDEFTSIAKELRYAPKTMEAIEAMLLSSEPNAAEPLRKNWSHRLGRVVETLAALERQRLADPRGALRSPVEMEVTIPELGAYRWRALSVPDDPARFTAGDDGGARHTAAMLEGLDLRAPERSGEPSRLFPLRNVSPALERLWVRILNDPDSPHRESALLLLTRARGHDPGFQLLLTGLLAKSAPTALREAAAENLAWIAWNAPRDSLGESALSRTSQAAIARALAAENASSDAKRRPFRISLARALEGARIDDLPTQLTLLSSLGHRDPSVRGAAMKSLLKSPLPDDSFRREALGRLGRTRDKELRHAIAQVLAHSLKAPGAAAETDLLEGIARELLRPGNDDWTHASLLEAILAHPEHLPEPVQILLWEAFAREKNPGAGRGPWLASLLAQIPPPAWDGVGRSALEETVLATLTDTRPEKQATREKAQRILAWWAKLGERHAALAKDLRREADDRVDAAASCAPSSRFTRLLRFIAGP